MKVKTLSLLAGAGSLLIAGTASAGIVGITITDVTSQMTGLDGYQANWNTYQYHVVFDNPTDELSAIGVVTPSTGPLNLQLTSGTFVHFSAPPFVPKSNFSQSDASAGIDQWVWDSYFTFGVDNNVGWDDGGSAPFLATPGYGLTWNHGGTSITSASDDGAIANTDTSGVDIGMAGHYPGLAVLFLQITVADGGGVAGTGGPPMTGVIGVAGGGDQMWFDLPAIPAPGALALLGLAGLAGVRRRRN